MENKRQPSRQPDQTNIDDLKAKLEQMDEYSFDEAVLDNYLEVTAEENMPANPINVEQSLALFKSKHAVLIDTLSADETVISRKSTGHKLMKRLAVAAIAAVLVGSMCVGAFSSNVFDLVAKWGDETFSFRSDFKNDNIGGIIYEDRSNGDADPDDYTVIPAPEDAETSLFSYPDSDTSSMGIEKSTSEWDESGSIETFHVLNMNIVDAVKAYGINEKLFPTWVPEGFMLDYVKVTRDYFYDQTDFMANYLHEDGTREFAVTCFTLSEGEDGGTTEKDERPVEIYTVHGVDWYIMHNLSRVNAVAMLGNREILFWGDVSVDEMKQIIDSVYE